MTTVDAALARRMLERALAMQTKPTLSADQVDDLMDLAADVDDEGVTFYSGGALNAAAATGWDWKQGLVSDQYDIGAGQGRTLDRSQWFAFCERMADAYASGRKQVLVTQRSTGRGIGSIGLVTSLGADEVW